MEFQEVPNWDWENIKFFTGKTVLFKDPKIKVFAKNFGVSSF